MAKLWLLSSTLVLLAWMYSKYSVIDGPPLTNNEGIVYYAPDRVHAPSSVNEIQRLIVKARESGRTIRALGSGHSWSTLSISDDMYISLYNYRGLVSINKNQKVVTFKGGTRLWEINAILAEHDLALSILPSISNQTIAGAIATGTHHTGVSFGNLVSFVTELELVTGTGEVLSITPESDSDLFHAAGVSLGLLGIITEVTLKCESIFNLEESRVSYSLSYCIENMNELSKSAEHVKLWVELNSESCTITGASRTVKPSDSVPVIKQPLTDILMKGHEAYQWIFSLFTFATNIGFKFFFSLGIMEPYNRVAISWEVFNIPHYVAPNHREGEIAVPYENCGDAVRELASLRRDLNIPVNHIVEIRFVKKDNVWMSNDYQTDTCHITLMMYNPSLYNWNLYTNEFYKATLKYRGRPHWGKSFNMTPGEVDELYPKFQEFLNVRKRLDPNGVFLNEVARDSFGL